MNINLNEMAQLTGELKAAINQVISDNPELNGLDLKRVIKKDPTVIEKLAGDTLHDNQLNRFIALAKGETELGQRGRKPSEETSKLSMVKSILSKSQKGTNDFSDEEVQFIKQLNSLISKKSPKNENGYEFTRMQELAGI